MPLGPGKYGANAEELLRKFGGDLCLVIMVGGPKGPSLDCATTNPGLLMTVPGILRMVADNIDGDVRTDISDILNKHKH